MQTSKNLLKYYFSKPGIFVALLLGILFLQAVLSMRQKSATFDEPNYLPAAYSYLVTRELRMEPAQPPLAKLIYGIPLLLLNLKDPRDVPSWQMPKGARYADEYKFGIDFLYHSGQDADKILFLGRISSVLISLLLGFWLFYWATQLYGSKSGYFALFLYVFSTDIIAHSQLVTADIAISCLTLITMYYFWRFQKNPSNTNLLICGICLGAALLIKHSALILIPAFLILTYINQLLRKNKSYELEKSLFSLFKKNKVLYPLRNVLFITIIALFIVWVGYGFEYNPLLVANKSHPSAELLLERYFPKAMIPNLINLSEKIPVPFPSFFTGLAAIRAPRRDTFLMGRHFFGAPWYGYLVAFLIKTQIPFLVFLVVNLFALLKKRVPGEQGWGILSVPILVFFIFSSFARFGLNLKYLLPVYPLLFVFTSQIVNQRFMRQILFKPIFIFLCLWYIFGCINIYPHYLAYFNEFVGGPKNGYKYLTDSNLDWGQDLKLLKQYLVKNNIRTIKLAYFGTADPAYYSIGYQKLEPFNSTAGWVAVSVTYLQGVHTAKGGYDWLKKYAPVANIGYSIFVYNIKTP